MRQISYAAAAMEAMVEEMRRNPRIIHLATDAPGPLVKEFGAQRVRGDTYHRVGFHRHGDWRGWLGLSSHRQLEHGHIWLCRYGSNCQSSLEDSLHVRRAGETRS